MAFLLSLLVLLLLALLLVRLGLSAFAAPLTAVASACLLMCFLGMAGLFQFSVILLYCLAALSALLLLRESGEARRALLKRFFCPATVFFAAASLAFYIILYIKQPYFQQWDEFSFWGIAAKNVFLHKDLYTLFESSQLSISYAPALPLFSCFIQYGAAVFSEWAVMAAYDVMTAAALAALFSGVNWRQPLRVLALAAFGAFGLYMFWYSFLGARLYATAYADIQLGVMLGGALALWFSKGERAAPRFLACLTALALLPMIKDMGLAFGLIAAFIMAADMLLGGGFPFKKYKWLWPLLLLALPALSYQSWNWHYAAHHAVDRSAVYYQYGLMQMLAGEDAYFNGLLAKMFGEELFTRQLVMFGPIIDMLLVFTALPLICALFCREKRGAARLCLASLLLCAGFFAYYFFLAYLYASVFAHSEDYYLPAFERYLSSYAIGWYISLVALCKSEGVRWRFKRPADGGALAAAAFTAAVFIFSPVHPDQYLLTSSKVQLELSDMRLAAKELAVDLKANLPEDARLYLICQASDGEEWFYLNYELQPLYLCRTLEGGWFVPESEERGRYDTFAGPEEFIAYLEANGIGYIVVERTDEYFEETFAHLFSDSLASFKEDGVKLYKTNGATSGARFDPVV
ncbi:MAG: hypothetical protein Q4B42_01060 [Oscillospiraceae bacterium]|nr:hypothetical protein [Oscillospiraceae bacterium]